MFLSWAYVDQFVSESELKSSFIDLKCPNVTKIGISWVTFWMLALYHITFVNY